MFVPVAWETQCVTFVIVVGEAQCVVVVIADEYLMFVLVAWVGVADDCSCCLGDPVRDICHCCWRGPLCCIGYCLTST